MAKYSLKVKIKNPKDIYNSGDKIEGVITIRNKQEKKGKPKKGRIKWVEVSFAEHIPVREDDPGRWGVNLDGSNEPFEGRLLGKPKKLSEWDKVDLPDNNPVKKPFSVKIPGGWRSNRGGQNPTLDWFVIMTIRLNTKLMGIPKFVRILPVPKSDRTTTLFD
ncbi:MAG: hypothetical protein ACTSR8_12540 [Promethearchaeota archaeon]